MSASGKTLFTQKLVSCLSNKTLYYSLDGGNHDLFQSAARSGRQLTMSGFQNKSTFGKLLKEIINFNEEMFEMWNIVIDPITLIPSKPGEFNEFLNALPKNHRYFFTEQRYTLEEKDYIKNYNKNQVFDRYSFLPKGSISIFNTIKIKNDILIYNYNTNEEYNFGDVAQIIRDIKINEILK